MAKSTYISTNLTEEQIKFLQLLDDNEILYFSLDDFEVHLEATPSNLNDLAENLCHKGLLNRIERGKYSRPQFNDPYVLGTYISKDGVIAYWTALHLHGLTDRFPNKVFVKTSRRKRNTTLFGTPIQFVTVDEKKLPGTITHGYGDRSFELTNPEVTFLDCFDQPRYAGDWPDLLRAFNQAKLDPEILIEKAKKYNKASVIKRIGYLSELYSKKELASFIDFAFENLSKKYTLIEPGGDEYGPLNSEWMLRMNMTEESLLQIIQNPY
jgi:predicted transcriptional regulator of viral defense system